LTAVLEVLSIARAATTMIPNTTSPMRVTSVDTTTPALKFAHAVQYVITEPAPTYERELIMGIFISLYITTQLAKLILPPLFPRINSITPGRQRQIFTLWPMMALKLTVCFLMAESEYALRFRPASTYHKPFELIHHQSNIFYVLVIGYMFELLHRPNPLELDYHHVFVMMSYTYYRVRFAHLFGTEASTSAMRDATTNLFHLAAIMVMYGVGPVDLASETMRFFYYAIEPKGWSVQVMRACVGVAWAGRIAQWTVMLDHLYRSVSSLVLAWGWLEMSICAVFIAYWIWMETVEMFFLIGLSHRYAGKVSKTKKCT
jgi:hypothetical protein